MEEGKENIMREFGESNVKVYVFDNDIRVSGTNLSENYFTHRTDRYVWFRNCPELCF